MPFNRTAKHFTYKKLGDAQDYYLNRVNRMHVSAKETSVGDVRKCIDRNGSLTLRRLMSYIYRAPILDVSRSHTTT